ncbi:gamma-butyrobetaine hydroxylase-like domain-containing protein [Actibacterium sp. 188UL27-1]
MRQVGNHGVSVNFSDGHDRAIYPLPICANFRTSLTTN